MPKKVYLCGACGSAPISTNREGSHRSCKGAPCACAAAGHYALPPEVREYQAGYCALTVEEVSRRDRGLDPHNEPALEPEPEPEPERVADDDLSLADPERRRIDTEPEPASTLF